MAFYEKTLESEIKFDGRIITVRRDKVEIEDGSQSVREVVEHPGGVGIVAVDDDGNVIMVRQYRYPMEQEILEIPAGKLEYGEDPLECAVRELEEETGYGAREFIDLGAHYPSPGYCKETLYIYLAVGLVPGRAHLDEGEFLSVEKIPMDKLVDMVMEDKLCDGKSVIGILKAERILKERKK